MLNPRVIPVACLLALGCVAAAEAELYSPPAAAEVRSRTLNWTAEQAVADPGVLQDIGKLWAMGDSTPSPSDLLDTVVETFALVDSDTAKLVGACRLESRHVLPPQTKLLTRSTNSDFYRANLGLFVARYLTRLQMFEEALEISIATDVQFVIDPASHLFFQAVCEHRLLMKDQGLVTIEKLLKNTSDVPVRYRTVAELMKYDLEALREKTLDEITRQMSDVERRLNLGRAGRKVQRVEEKIISTLDEIIKKLEQQQGGGGGGADGNQNRSNSPAPDSVVKGSTAPGNVDQKNIGNKVGWGSLPPKTEARAKNLINRNFPSHYREAIEKYFKKLANRRASSGE